MDSEAKETITEPTTDLFTNWGPYTKEEVIKALEEKKFTFIPPKPNAEYRQKIQPIISDLSEDDKLILKICLTFLEKGLLIDNFGKNEEERHTALLNNKIEINGQPIRLYEFSKTVNKLAGNPINSILTAAQILNNQDIRNEAEKIAKKIKELKQNRSFFKPEDIDDVDKLAQKIIDFILNKYQ